MVAGVVQFAGRFDVVFEGIWPILEGVDGDCGAGFVGLVPEVGEDI